jgi:ferredoxin
VGSVSKFEGTPPEQDPRFIAPKAKSIIGLGFRILRGSLRGIEEGTHFYQYPEMGIVHIDEVHAPEVLRGVACFLEDRGFEGVVQRSVPDRRPGYDKGNNPEHLPVTKIKYAEPVEKGKPAPDVYMDFKQAAKICGMGEIGDGGFFLTPRFGPLQRFAFVLTDAEIEPDEEFTETLCDHCGMCVSACPVKAISTMGELDEWQCTAGRMGANAATNPFIHSEETDNMPERFDEDSVKKFIPLFDEAYPQVRFKYTPSICGVACQRACLAHLEEKDVLKDKFVNKFRNKPVWKT